MKTLHNKAEDPENESSISRLDSEIIVKAKNGASKARPRDIENGKSIWKQGPGGTLSLGRKRGPSEDVRPHLN